MLASELVHAPLKRLAQAEIITVQRQYLIGADGVKHPVREFDFHFLHPAIAGLAHNLEAVNQAEAFEDLDVTRHDIRGDARASKALKSRLELFVAAPIGPAVGCCQEVIGAKADVLADLPAMIDRRHDLADAEDKHVAVMHGGQAEN